jgi:glycerol-3-phosphate acyltransferase PlsY
LVKLIKGEDIRNFGSGNIGATNVARVLGRKWAVVTAAVDMFKGGAAILVAMAAGRSDPTLLALTGLAGIIGHDYPVWIKFKGGKGVASTFGVFGCYDFFNPLPAIIGGVVWLCVRELSCVVSLSSMVALGVAALLMPVFSMPRPYYVCGAVCVLLTVWRHRENIGRIISGKENKVKPFLLKQAKGAGKSS